MMMAALFRFFGSFIAFLLLVSWAQMSRAAEGARPNSSGISCPIRSGCTVHYQFLDQRLFVPVLIGGSPRPWAFIFDSGGSNILDIEAARHLGLSLKPGPPISGAGNSQLPSWTTDGVNFSIGSASATNQSFLIFDLSSIKKVFHFKRLDGIVGFEILNALTTRIDYQNQIMTFYRGPAPSLPGESLLRLQLENEYAVVHGSVDGVNGDFLVDTGDRSAFSLCDKFAFDTGLDHLFDGNPEVDSGFGVGGPIPARLANIQALSIGQINLSNVMTRLPDMKSGFFATSDLAGSIGNEVLKRFTVTFDYSHLTMTLKKNSLFDEPSCFTSVPDSAGGDFQLCEPKPFYSARSTPLKDLHDIEKLR